jgi:hypothetical protein
VESRESYPRRKPVPWRQLGGDALVVDVKAGLLYPLNAVGARIWELSDGARSVEAIIEALRAEFDADEPTIRQDTADFLRELRQRELISLEDGPRPLAGE